MADRELSDLTQARERLAALDRERAAVCRVIAELEVAAGGPDITTAEGRVALFISLFRGRRDAFATRWQSAKTGRSGWAPRSLNEWQPGVCHKPKVKCADCAHRHFVAFTDAEVRRHLEGRQVAGIYPLRADESCWLVAIDLDGPSWQEDVVAPRDSARELDVPVLVERSRSGQGAHVWVLFSQPIPARVARGVGSLLLTRAMCRRTISMASYDRLFPIQGTMPARGFGNLIALPLQRELRVDGCTVFLDEDLQPFPDQWVYLAGVERLDADRAGELATDDVLGLAATGPGQAETASAHACTERIDCGDRTRRPRVRFRVGPVSVAGQAAPDCRIRQPGLLRTRASPAVHAQDAPRDRVPRADQ